MSKRPYKVQASSTRVAFGTPSLLQNVSATSSVGQGSHASQLSYLVEPPSVDQVSDSRLVVLLKNLSKRDGTTKAKALDDILGHIASSKIETDDSVVEAWTKLYARLSIDIHRRVRQLAHTVNGVISRSAGKGIARFMSRICSPWLAGLYDNDKIVSKAAQEALSSLLPTKEKLLGLRKAYQKPILQYCTSVICNETVDSLSDARTVSTDDAEAKYARTVATCVCLLQDLLQTLPSEDRERYQSLYDDIFASDKLWTFVSAKDPFLSKSTLKFFQVCLTKMAGIEAKNKISSAVLYNILNDPRENTINDMSDTLVTLTSSHPQVWTIPFRNWHPRYQSLKKLITIGPRAKPAHFWENVEKIIKLIPTERLPDSADSVFELLDIIQEGIEKNNRSFGNDIAGLKAYIQVLCFLSSLLSYKDQVAVAKQKAWPLVAAHVERCPDISAWEPDPSEIFEVITKILSIKAIHSIATEEWVQITKDLSVGIQTLPPEQSKNYHKSQLQIVIRGYRWSSVQRLLFESEIVNLARNELDQALMDILKSSLDVLETREGKPFGAAGVANHIIEKCCKQITRLQPAQNVIASFVEKTLPRLINSPSDEFLSNILYAQTNRDDFESVWNSTLNVALEDAKLRPNNLMVLLDKSNIPHNFSLPKLHKTLQEYINETFKLAIQGHRDWKHLLFALHNVGTFISDENQENLILELLKALQSGERITTAIEALKIVLDGQNSEFLANLLAKPLGYKILSEILSVSELSDEGFAEDSDRIQQQLRSLSRDDYTGIEESTINVIQINLGAATTSSLSTEKMIYLAKDLMKQARSNVNTLAERLMPSVEDWNELVRYYARLPPADDLKITSNFGGTIALIDREPCSPNMFTKSMISTDSQGLTKLVRTAKYFAKLCCESEALLMLEQAVIVELYKPFVITMQLIDDNITLAGIYKLWDRNMEDIGTEILEIIAMSNRLLNEWSQRMLFGECAFVRVAILDFYNNAHGISPISFYNARVLASRIAELIELHGSQKYQDLLPGMSDKIYKQAQEDALVEAALITGLGNKFLSLPPNVKIWNKIISDLTGMHITDELTEQKVLKSLVALSLTFSNDRSMVETVAKQRLVFLVKQLVLWLDDPISKSTKREIMEVLVIILPLIESFYGSHWKDVMTFMFSIIKSHPVVPCIELTYESNLPLLHSSLKLYAKLRIIKDSKDANEDIVDSWNDSGDGAVHCLVALLKTPQGMADEEYLPLKVVNELLCRQILNSNSLHFEDISDLFKSLNSQSRTVQETAFQLLHKRIPLVQEQVSIDADMENKKATLSGHLISILSLSPKTVNGSFSETTTRGYLLAWILLFDHFELSSLKVRSDYADDIKDGDYLSGFLEFMCESLGHDVGKPYDASKINVEDYSSENDLSTTKDTQWLLSHVYFLALVNLASIVKSWWLNCNSRQTALSVELWTMKHMTPHVVKKTLSTVNDWVESQNKESEDYLTVAINYRVGEITASYPIDEQRISIVIRFPDAFPLNQALVEGVNRVAVEERKWQAWLRSTQGVIAFQNNSIVDGLVAWRRNVFGALKGQTECAICYSIISADKQLPNKKCSTCKKIFHSDCLYKWFRSSNSSSCPLCRNPFKYG